MQGSLRQRSIGSWELRVFIGVDPTNKRRRYQSATVRGSRTEAERKLANMVAAAITSITIQLAPNGASST